MKSIVLAAGVAAVALMGGSAMAAPKAKMVAAVAAPAQPIPYAQLDAYLKASPKERASRDWWAGAAATGAPADASASTAATSDTSTAAAPAAPVNPAPDASTSPGATSSATPSTDATAAPPADTPAATPAPDASAAPMAEPKPQ